MSNTEDHSTGAAVEKISGVVLGIVTNNQDPDNLGRVKLKFPWRDDKDESEWARSATLMGGNDRGTFFLPEVGDEVLVSFEHGDIQQPYVVGALWNGKDKPPTSNQNGKNDIRMIKTRSGHKVVFNDESGKETVEVHTKAGHKIILDDSSGSEKIEIKDKTGSNSIAIDSTQNSVTIKSGAKISLQAPMIEIKADASLDLKGGIVKIN